MIGVNNTHIAPHESMLLNDVLTEIDRDLFFGYKLKERNPMETLEILGRLVLMLMIIGSGALIVWVNVRENPYIDKKEDDDNAS